MAKQNFSHYVVFRGRVPGIYVKWLNCKAQTNGFKGSKFKGYPSAEEAVKAWKAFNDQ